MKKKHRKFILLEELHASPQVLSWTFIILGLTLLSMAVLADGQPFGTRATIGFGALTLGALGGYGLRSSKRKFYSLSPDLVASIDRDTDPLFVARADGVVLYANASAKSWMGGTLKPDDLIEDVLAIRQSPSLIYRMSRQALNEGFAHELMPKEHNPSGNLALSVQPTAADNLIWRLSNQRGQETGAVLPSNRSDSESLIDSELWSVAPIGALLVEATGIIYDHNKLAAQMLRGVEKGESFLARIESEDRALVADMIKTAADGAATHPLMIRVSVPQDSTPAKEIKHVQLHIAPAGKTPFGERDDYSKLLRVFLIDASQQARLEAQFVQSQKMHAIGQLAGGMAHDFNNLLTAVGGHCDLLLARKSAGDEDFSEMTQIRQNVNRAAALVAQLLAFSRRQTLQPKFISLIDVFSDLVHLLQRLLGEKIKFKLEHVGELGFVRVDKGQFEQVIINLAVNARDAMKDKGEITIRTSSYHQEYAKEFGKFAIPAGEYALIEVIDNGCGLPDVDQDRLFEPFYTTKSVGAGTGLGLSTVYGIIKQSGGFILAENRPEGGAIFSIYLPQYDSAALEKQAVDQQENEPEKQEIEQDLTGGEKTVMLVEDEDAVRSFAERALQRQGYTVLSASSAEEALEIMRDRSQPLDLLISDVVMPGMNGTELATHAREIQPQLQVILISGYAEEVFRQNLNENEAYEFLPKPFSLTQLVEKANEALGTQKTKN